jgi:hypothetical protein
MAYGMEDESDGIFGDISRTEFDMHPANCFGLPRSVSRSFSRNKKWSIITPARSEAITDAEGAVLGEQTYDGVVADLPRW